MQLINNCQDPNDSQLSFTEAKDKCLSLALCSLPSARLNIRDSLNRVLANDVFAPINVPLADNSAMDGYALKKSDLAQSDTFTVVAASLAGNQSTVGIKTGQAIKITTGALIPKGADMVIPQEQTEAVDDINVRILNYTNGNNIRLAGEDLKKNTVALAKGHRISPADLGLLASLGINKVSVYQKLKVAFLSTGDELKSINEPLSAGEVYDSNRYSLFGLLKRLDAEIFDLGVVVDSPDAIRKAFITAAMQADVILSTGGVSVGQADFVKQVLREIGQINFWKLAIKPGRPLAFGKINDSFFFGLPGNPVATVVTFYQIVQPFLKKMMGQTEQQDATVVLAENQIEIHKSPKRVEFIRAHLSMTNNKLIVKKLDRQGSGVLSSVCMANCLMILDEPQAIIESGAMVKVQPFFALV